MFPIYDQLPADALGYTKIIPAFLDPDLKLQDLPHGVSFASAGSGYDDLTANISVTDYGILFNEKF